MENVEIEFRRFNLVIENLLISTENVTRRAITDNFVFQSRNRESSNFNFLLPRDWLEVDFAFQSRNRESSNFNFMPPPRVSTA